mgnify:CR=1 FL=1
MQFSLLANTALFLVSETDRIALVEGSSASATCPDLAPLGHDQTALLLSALERYRHYIEGVKDSSRCPPDHDET